MNVFLQDLIYLTLQDYKDSSTSGLIAKTNDEIQITIGKAEDMIKNKIIYEVPTISLVDKNIKKATVLLTDCIYSYETREILSGRVVTSEKEENYSKTYEIRENIETPEDCLNNIKDLLKPYISSYSPRVYRT